VKIFLRVLFGERIAQVASTGRHTISRLPRGPHNNCGRQIHMGKHPYISFAIMTASLDPVSPAWQRRVRLKCSDHRLMPPEPMPDDERFLRSVRQACLDHLFILHERQLQRMLNASVQYLNQARPHQGIRRTVSRTAWWTFLTSS
jgi:hypothetical protein